MTGHQPEIPDIRNQGGTMTALETGTPERLGELDTAELDTAVNPAPGALEPAEIQELAALGTVKTFRRQTVVVSEGDDNESFYVILAGRVKFFVSDEQGREIVLGTCGPGEYFGEVALSDDGPRAASVITLETVRTAIVPRPKLVEFLGTHPELALKMLKKMARRLRSLTKTVKSLALVDVYGRVTRLLEELATLNGGTGVIERMTQQEIANRVGASREMISRVMRGLAAEGRIEISKTQIRLLKGPEPG